jgi:mRNA interferase MazF
VYAADLDPVRGSEQADQRPVLVVSREVINQRLPIVAVLPLTTARPGRRVYSTEVLLPAGVGGLAAASVVMAHQVRTLAVKRLGTCLGALVDPDRRQAVRQALALYLDLE